MGLFNTFMITCRDATYLHGKQKEGGLSFSERTGLRLHLMFCSLCRLFFKQLDELEEHTHHLAHSNKTGASLHPSAREKMQHALNNEMKKK